MRVSSALAGVLRTVRGSFLAPAPCAGCPDGHAQQDWTVTLGGQVHGYCSHCGARLRTARPDTTSATKR